MEDAKREPATSESKDERDPARTATTEFRIPPKVNLTRPDIPVRRPAEPRDDSSEEDPAEDAPEQPAEDEDPQATSSEDASSEDEPEPDEAPADAPPEPDAPASDGTGPTRVERLPTQPAQATPPQAAPTPSGPPQATPQQAEPPQAAPPPRAAPPQAPPPAPLQEASPQGAQPQPVGPQAAQEGVPSQLGVPSPGQWGVAPDGAVPPAPPAPPVSPAAPATAGEEAKGKLGRRGIVILAAALLLVVGFVTGQLVRPVPDPAVDLAIASSHAFPGQAPALPWPSAGQAAVHVEGLGTMGSSGGTAPTPTASVAKVMTAYVYLSEHPLKPGEPGPVMTVSPQAAAQIPMRKQRGESILGVTANQKLTQRKALEALLIISANDVAHELARWDAGSQQAFVAKMNATATSLGMTATRYTDPSGYDSGTVSTAADQVKLLRAAMKIPAFAEIVSERAYEPGDGGPVRQGGNFLLGQYGVVGGKTGYTDAAGGNFVFAARQDVRGVNTLIVGAVMGQKSASAAGAVDAAERLVVAAENAMVAATLAPKGATVARVDDGLGGKTPLRAAAPVTVVGWPGLTVPVGVEGDPPHEGDTGDRVGAVTAGAATVPLELARTLDEPSIVKRLIRLG